MEILNLKTTFLNQNNYSQNLQTPEFVGSLITYPIDYVHPKCLPCDGFVLKRIDYEQLFSVIGTKFNDGIFSMDIAGAYNCDGLESILRSFSFTEDSVTLTDKFTYSGDGEIVERLVSLIKPTYENGVLSVEDTVIDFDPHVCDLELNEEQGDRNHCYFMDFKLKNGVREFICTIK